MHDLLVAVQRAEHFSMSSLILQSSSRRTAVQGRIFVESGLSILWQWCRGELGEVHCWICDILKCVWFPPGIFSTHAPPTAKYETKSIQKKWTAGNCDFDFNQFIPSELRSQVFVLSICVEVFGSCDLRYGALFPGQSSLAEICKKSNV